MSATQAADPAVSSWTDSGGDFIGLATTAGARRGADAWDTTELEVVVVVAMVAFKLTLDALAKSFLVRGHRMAESC